MSSWISRRRFLKASAAAAAVGSLGPAIVHGQNLNSKLNIACIGVGGKGSSDSNACKAENVVAICDVDSINLGKAAQRFPGAKTFADYRMMLGQMKEIDAVTVSTPDHHHAVASMMAIKLGKHVFCQKPLTHTIAEARAITEAARKYKVATQMGNQGHSGEGYRLLCEWLWAGAIGDVNEVHCWTNRPIWPQGLDRPEGADPVPDTLNWDLWLGPAALRPYKDKIYHNFKWRGWWDFGCGALGDMGCHIMDGACWALKLTNPTSVEVIEQTGVKPEMAPKSSVLKYNFPARGNMPPCALFWHDGGKLPTRPDDLEEGRKLAEGDNGSLFIGSKGKIMTGTYGGGTRIFPETKMQAWLATKPEKTIPRVKDHAADWIRSCKDGKPSSANFEYAGPFTEIVLLGNLALRVNKTIQWDAANMVVTNVPEANQYVKKEYRKGWEI